MAQHGKEIKNQLDQCADAMGIGKIQIALRKEYGILDDKR